MLTEKINEITTAEDDCNMNNCAVEMYAFCRVSFLLGLRWILMCPEDEEFI